MTLIQILTLLQAAVSLLVSAQAPHVPQSLREQAITIANHAIVVANQSLLVPSPSMTPKIIPFDPLPPKEFPPKMLVQTTIEHGSEEVYPHGLYSFRVSALDRYGKYIVFAPITMIVPDKSWESHREELQKTAKTTTKESNDWFATFRYIPTATGTKLVVFHGPGSREEVFIEVNR